MSLFSLSFLSYSDFDKKQSNLFHAFFIHPSIHLTHPKENTNHFLLPKLQKRNQPTHLRLRQLHLPPNLRQHDPPLQHQHHSVASLPPRRPLRVRLSGSGREVGRGYLPARSPVLERAGREAGRGVYREQL